MCDERAIIGEGIIILSPLKVKWANLFPAPFATFRCRAVLKVHLLLCLGCKYFLRYHSIMTTWLKNDGRGLAALQVVEHAMEKGVLHVQLIHTHHQVKLEPVFVYEKQGLRKDKASLLLRLKLLFLLLMLSVERICSLSSLRKDLHFL